MLSPACASFDQFRDFDDRGEQFRRLVRARLATRGGRLMAKKLAFDKVLFTAVCMLVAVGLVMVYSASGALARDHGAGANPFLVKQALAAALGFAAMWRGDARRLPAAAQPGGRLHAWSVGALALLVAVLFAPELNNTRRWFFVGGLSVQPSELAKLALVPFLAYQIEKKHDRVNSRELLVPCAVVTALMAGLVAARARPRHGRAAGGYRRACCSSSPASPGASLVIGLGAALPVVAWLILSVPTTGASGCSPSSSRSKTRSAAASRRCSR